jgi:surface protein
VRDTEDLIALLRKPGDLRVLDTHGTAAAYDIRALTSIRGAFRGLDRDVDVTFWDTSHITDMSFLASDSSAKLIGIEKWNTARAMLLESAFAGSSFDQDIGKWDVGRVQSMESMFRGTSDAAVKFNQDIRDWDTRSLRVMSSMFRCSLFNQDISKWDVSNVTDMRSMLFDASAFNRDISSWATGNLRQSIGIFGSCPLPDEYKPRTGVTIIGPTATKLKRMIEFEGKVHIFHNLDVLCVDRPGPTRILINKGALSASVDEHDARDFRAKVQHDILSYVCSRTKDVSFNWVHPLSKSRDWTCDSKRAHGASSEHPHSTSRCVVS